MRRKTIIISVLLFFILGGLGIFKLNKEVMVQKIVGGFFQDVS
jgi:hypothetical protein